MGEHQSDIKIIDEYGQESGHIPARHRAIYLLPNAFTTAALFAGFFAIVKAMNHEFDIAAVAIFCAMVLDGLGLHPLWWYSCGNCKAWVQGVWD